MIQLKHQDSNADLNLQLEFSSIINHFLAGSAHMALSSKNLTLMTLITSYSFIANTAISIYKVNTFSVSAWIGRAFMNV